MLVADSLLLQTPESLWVKVLDGQFSMTTYLRIGSSNMGTINGNLSQLKAKAYIY